MNLSSTSDGLSVKSFATLCRFRWSSVRCAHIFNSHRHPARMSCGMEARHALGSFGDVSRGFGSQSPELPAHSGFDSRFFLTIGLVSTRTSENSQLHGSSRAHLGMPTHGHFARLARASMVETLKYDYIRTAYGKGLSDSRVVFSHAPKKLSHPHHHRPRSYSGKFGDGFFLVEVVFQIPGMGSTSYNGDESRLSTRYGGNYILRRNSHRIATWELILYMDGRIREYSWRRKLIRRPPKKPGRRAHQAILEK